MVTCGSNALLHVVCQLAGNNETGAIVSPLRKKEP
jgi:hypothetical protein